MVLKSVFVIVPGGTNANKLASNHSWTSRWRARRKTLSCKKLRVNRCLSRFKMNWGHSWSTRPLSVRTQSFVHHLEWLTEGSGTILLPFVAARWCPNQVWAFALRACCSLPFLSLICLRITFKFWYSWGATRIWRLGVHIFEYLQFLVLIACLHQWTCRWRGIFEGWLRSTSTISHGKANVIPNFVSRWNAFRIQ